MIIEKLNIYFMPAPVKKIFFYFLDLTFYCHFQETD
jgi:hypothetical protein